MTTQTSFLRRDPAEVTPWAETCGAIRCLIGEVIDGEGSMVLDDEEIELHQGVVVYVPRGMKHKAIGKLTVLTVCIPRGVLDDVHEVE